MRGYCATNGLAMAINRYLPNEPVSFPSAFPPWTSQAGMVPRGLESVMEMYPHPPG
jgi:hypothetical protein